MIEIELPWPPSVNHYKTVGRLITTTSGKIYQQRKNSNETKKFYYDVYMLSKNLPREATERCFPEAIDLEVGVSLHPPHSCRYDLDNRLKVLMDSLMHARIIHDDSQIHRLIVEKKEMVEGGKAIVRINEL